MMAGQGPSRRQLLQAIACASLAGAAPGFSRWAYGFAEGDPQRLGRDDGTSRRPRGEYKPSFFSPSEFKTIGILAELIIPGTSSSDVIALQHTSAAGHMGAVRPQDAGATDAGVDEFIDFMVAADQTLQTPFREGLVWLDQENGYMKPFSALEPVDQNTLLERLAYSSKFRPEDRQGQVFFSLVRKYSVMGFYTSRIGIESLDYPGFRHYTMQPSAPSDGSLPPMTTQEEKI
jgi:gluconate 2-dehydrogenase gamma chain